MYNVVYHILGNSRVLKLLSSDFSCNNIFVVWEYQRKQLYQIYSIALVPRLGDTGDDADHGIRMSLPHSWVHTTFTRNLGSSKINGESSSFREICCM